LLTIGTTISETAIALTPISGALDEAALNVSAKHISFAEIIITQVGIKTVKKPLIIPDHAPAFVVFLL